MFRRFLSFVKNYILPTAAALLGGVFLLSGTAKILYWADTTLAVEKLLFTDDLTFPITAAIVTLELFLGVFVLLPRYWRISGLFSVVVLIVFTSAVLWGKTKGLITECPCFGKLFGATIGPVLVSRNSILILCGLLLVSQVSLLKSEFSRKVSWIECFTMAIVVILLILITSVGTHAINRDKPLLDRTNLREFPIPKFSRSYFASISEIKEKLTHLHPDTDSISMVLLRPNIELYDLYSNQGHEDRYLAIIEDVDCAACDDLHFLVKLSGYKMQDFIFLLPIDDITRRAIQDQFKAANVRTRFGIRNIVGNPKWSYYFLKGLRDASDALQNANPLNQLRQEGQT